MPLHEVLGEVFAPFQLRALFGRADNRDFGQSPVVFEIIGNARYQRGFRSYHEHVNVMGNGKFTDCREIVGF